MAKMIEDRKPKKLHGFTLIGAWKELVSKQIRRKDKIQYNYSIHKLNRKPTHE